MFHVSPFELRMFYEIYLIASGRPLTKEEKGNSQS